MNLALGLKVSDDEAMQFALQLAAKGYGFTAPNPNVGCVVTNADQIVIGFGYHQKFGGPHAEVEALQGVSPEALSGARIFVTLEPCAHEGKTPSCAKMLAKLPVAEVIYGLQDPNPLVAGQGAEILKSAGIKATLYQGLLAQQLEEVAEHFLFNYRKNKVWISLKVAVSLDGSLALSNGESQWITGAESREFAHYLRAGHQAIMVGVNTLFQDNPSLDVRHKDFPGHRNKVLVMDPFGRGISKLEESQILKTHQASEVYVIVGPEAKIQGVPTGVHVIGVPWLGDRKAIDLSALNTKLWDLGFRSVLVEGGAATLSEYLTQAQAHRHYQFIAPIILGAGKSIAWSKGFSVDNMQQRLQLKYTKTQAFGPDILLTGLFI